MIDDIAKTAAKILLDTRSVLFNVDTPFTYTSGNKGPVYVDCRRPLSFPKERAVLIESAAQILNDEIGADKIDMIAGAETAGIPYGALIAARMEKPLIYVRKKAKGHGRMAQIEGYFAEGSAPNVVLTEDLQNFGHSKKVFIDALRQAGAQIGHFFVLFDYGIRPGVAADNAAMGLAQHSLCNWHDVLAVAAEHKYFDVRTIEEVKAYLENPAQWAA